MDRFITLIPASKQAIPESRNEPQVMLKRAYRSSHAHNLFCSKATSHYDKAPCVSLTGALQYSRGKTIPFLSRMYNLLSQILSGQELREWRVARSMALMTLSDHTAVLCRDDREHDHSIPFNHLELPRQGDQDLHRLGGR